MSKLGEVFSVVIRAYYKLLVNNGKLLQFLREMVPFLPKNWNAVFFCDAWCRLLFEYSSDSFASVPKVAYETKYSRMEQVKFVEDSH